jgi:hypothetical protein
VSLRPGYGRLLDYRCNFRQGVTLILLDKRWNHVVDFVVLSFHQKVLPVSSQVGVIDKLAGPDSLAISMP